MDEPVEVIPGGITPTTARLRLNRRWAEHPVSLEPASGAAPRPRIERLGLREDCWIVDATDLLPDTVYKVRVAGRVGDPPLAIRTPPLALDGSNELLLGLQSCYFPSTGERENALAVLACWDERAKRGGSSGKPHATILCGDQVYADVPAGGFDAPERIYRERYRELWAPSRLGGGLQRGAHFFTGDDHEFWNDYPKRQPHLSRSWDKNWEPAAKVAIEHMWLEQGLWNFAPGVDGGKGDRRSWCHTELCSGVKLFVADTRTDRTDYAELPGDRKVRVRRPGDAGVGIPDGSVGFMAPAQERALAAWLAGLRERDVGLLVLGQPLVHEGSRTDLALASFPEQFAELLAGIDRAMAGGATLVVLSGDIHWARLLELGGPGAPYRGRLFEFVSSPVGLVAGGHYLGSWMPALFPARPSKPRVGWDAPKERPAGWREPVTHFVSSMRNMGVIQIRRDPDGRPRRQLELWDLREKRLALDHYSPRHCQFRT